MLLLRGCRSLGSGGGHGAALLLVVGVDHALAHVLLQSGGDAEGHVAEAALVDILAHSAVRPHVSREFGALRARVVAQLALVRLLARVRPPVHGEVGAVLEDFPAVLARVVSRLSHQLPPRVGVEERAQSPLLRDRLERARLHGRQRDARRQGRDVDVADGRPLAAAPSLSSDGVVLVFVLVLRWGRNARRRQGHLRAAEVPVGL